ncbi:hypothetical protein TCT1_15910 [Xenorhabdus sp. TCT-1]|uniref:Lipoprotein n=2 Tax=Xenorhabdus taiwanensis TaxID=3085177 RepID=A0ABM8JVE5_9GAMM|nr:hypothetical protein TCT1_15910 [Xenorhabdus sp. TCT-1]
MKKYILLILVMIALSCSACSSDMKITETKHFLKPDDIVLKSDNLGLAGMKECGKGYVVGVWSHLNEWNEWGVWLSEKGRSYSYGDSKFYWAYDYLNLDHDNGRNAYATILAAEATGQIVELLDDKPGNCMILTVGKESKFDGPRFNSVKAFFP